MFKSFDAVGNMIQNPAYGTPGGSFCVTSSTVGKDGTVYMTVSSLSIPTQYYVQAWKNNSLVWQYTIPCSPDAYPTSMVMGANDNVYMVMQRGNSSCGNDRLIGLSPTAQPGTNPPVPQVVMDQTLSVSWVPSNGLAVYNDGLVLYTSSGIKYVEYSGSSGSPVTVANTLQNYYLQTTESWFGATTSGRVFVPTRANAGASAGCSDTNNVVGSIVAVDPTAQNNIAWTINISACAYVHEIHPLPNNGFVMRYGYVTPGSSASLSERITAFDGNGQAMWSQTVQDVSQVGSYAMSADLNGNVALRADVAPWRTVNGSTYRFPEIDITLFGDLNGTVLSQVNLRGEFDTTSGPSYKGGNAGELSMARNTFYVTAQQCTTLNNCDGSSTKLYAFTVPGLQMDYPRGAILGVGSGPRQHYAALGDSFSAGQGVSPFDDTSGCNRSTRAYPRLIDQGINDYDLVVPPSLSAFVACSGATTSNVLNGQNGEGPQVDALRSDTKLVTITIGGNDIGFADFVTKCLYADCAAVKQDYLDRIASLGTALNQVYNTILNDAPDATVYVLGYPELLSGDQDCTYVQGQQQLEWILEVANAINNSHLADVRSFLEAHGFTESQVDDVIANGGNVQFTQDEQAAAHDLVVALDNKIKDTIGTIRPRLRYVDPLASGSPFAGHQLCTMDQYFTGVDLAHPTYSFHPNALGQEAYRQLLLSAV
jgi:lysophospholipase L1-like esterase